MSSSSPTSSPPSRPIPIPPNRTRSVSITTSPSSLAPSLLTPRSPNTFVFSSNNTSPSSTMGSPSLHTKAHSASALDDDDSSPRHDLIAHARRASASASTWQPPNPGPPSPITDRGAALMRRLSLSIPFQRPSIPPPPSALPSKDPPSSLQLTNVPTIAQPVPRKRRAMSTAVPQPRKRPISPMGERLLKGHFDGFI